MSEFEKLVLNLTPEESKEWENLKRAYGERTSVGMFRVMMAHFLQEQPEVTITRTVGPKELALAATM